MSLVCGPDGLVSAVLQDAVSDAVLMVGFMNAEALAATRATGLVHFWSRSRARLWRKGETSGHVARVRDIYVNCDRNGLLLTVDQEGAVCHDGYPTCYYRRLEPDGSLTVVSERAFDPAAVYGGAPSPETHLAHSTRLLVGAYAYLRDHDLADRSRTSALLRAPDDRVSPRVADELRELAGVLDGTHAHADPHADALLEATQCLYWLTLAALRAGADWATLRPDRALATGDDGVTRAVAARLLRAEADRWSRPLAGDGAARGHATLALVAQACRAADIPPAEVVAGDLGALREKPYLAPYFAEAPA